MLRPLHYIFITTLMYTLAAATYLNQHSGTASESRTGTAYHG